MPRLLGIETEYGIHVEGRAAGDLVAESTALVRCHAGRHVTGWNYRAEDPRRDLRGFRVDHLARDPQDARFDPPGRAAHGTPDERSDRVLPNGARLYNDHGHPEYSTPECASLRDLVAHDRAGERIVWECARRRMAEAGVSVSLYKNNTDYHGASYGTHESYLMRRDVPADDLIAGLTPFLVTRILYAGAGKVGVEGEPGALAVPYQLSQRADFVAVEASVDTLHNRPLVNTRDEPHATPRDYLRLHVIVGDANMSEWATAMKVGATSLVLSLLEEGWRPPLRVRSPVTTLREVSRDPSLRWLVTLGDGRTMGAVDVQRTYLEEAERRLAGASEGDDWALREWRAVLDDLERDVLGASDRVDWVAKRRLLEAYMAEEGIGWDDPAMQSLDLAYHDLDPETGLFAGLEQAGAMRRVVSDALVEAAVSCPPSDTRAMIRGMFVCRFPESVRAIGWNGVAFHHDGEDLLFDMNPLVGPGVALLNEELAAARTLDDVVAVIRRGLEPGSDAGA
ncbi:MAG: proteasome accessory factor PafA2 family protein [Chthonomonadales bacterium]|nr:proteasome accessory factor PafA2 family protein [Chthonomonadales bacterium]